MTDPSIIDYASPRPRGATRLPASSVLDVQVRHDEIRIIEVLTGKKEAVAAIIFALCVMAVMATVSYALWGSLYNGDLVDRLVTFSLYPCLPVFVEAILIVLVINSTWRKTILHARLTEWVLLFTSPVQTRKYRWRPADVQGVNATQTGISASRDILGELHMVIAGQDVRLFTDHYLAVLTPLATNLRGFAGLAEPVMAVATLTTVPPPAPPAGSSPIPGG